MQNASTVGKGHDVLGEISTKGDFPAIAKVIENLHALTRREDASALVIARVILQDPGLSSKILRVVNSAFYRTRSNPISTVTRAVILLGVERVRDVATSLLLVEQVVRQGQSSETVRDHLHRSLLCAMLAQELAVHIGNADPEEAYLLGLFSNFGMLWLAAYYADEFDRVLRISGTERKSLEQATVDVFGFTTRELTAHVLEQWNFPESYAHHFRRPLIHEASSVLPATRVSALVMLVADYVHAIGEADEPPAFLVARFHSLFNVGHEELLAATTRAQNELNKHETLLGIARSATETRADEPGGRPRDPIGTRGRADVPGPSAAPSHEGAVPQAPPASGTAPEPSYAEPAPTTVTAGRSFSPEPARSAIAMLADITRSLLDGDDVPHLLLMTLEATARSAGCEAVFLAIVNPEGDALVGGVGYGEGVESYVRHLLVPLRSDEGMLATTVLDHTPHVVTAGSAELLARRAAAGKLPVSSFITYPLSARGRTIGVLFAGRAGGPPVGESELVLVQVFAQSAALVLTQRRA